MHTLGCTVAAYAQKKRLPAEFLARLGLTEILYANAPALRIPYFDRQGQQIAVRIRTELEKSSRGDNRFRWRKGSKPSLYGLDRLRQEAEVVLVEGESDCHTLWFRGLNAVGLPGAGLWREERDAAHLSAFETIYVVVEPDLGGEALLVGLRKSSLRERMRLVRLTGFMDPSELHTTAPDQFENVWNEAVQAAEPWATFEAGQQDDERAKAWAACKELAGAPNLLDRFAQELRQLGVVGVERKAKLLYLAVTSRVLDRPISVAVKGPSSAGKSYVAERTLSFFPEDAYYAITAMSERALAYSDEPLRHRMLVLVEADGMHSEFASYLLRSLLSEGCLRYETVEKTPVGMQARLIERGPDWPHRHDNARYLAS